MIKCFIKVWKYILLINLCFTDCKCSMTDRVRKLAICCNTARPFGPAPSPSRSPSKQFELRVGPEVSRFLQRLSPSQDWRLCWADIVRQDRNPWHKIMKFFLTNCKYLWLKTLLVTQIKMKYSKRLTILIL